MKAKAIEVDGQWLIPLPQDLLDELGIVDQVEVTERDGSLVLKAPQRRDEEVAE